MKSHLTHHMPGSMRELWAISWPLVIASAANMLMVLADRVVVAKYSTLAFHSLSGTVAWWWTVYCALLDIALVADVFVGRFNGSQEWRKIGPAIWQMLWFSAATIPIMIAVSIWIAPHLLAENLRPLGLSYMRILFVTTPIPVAAIGALGSFFTGRGKTRVILFAAIFCNVINVVLDIV